ncbi:MAG TPA: hypothetical protein VG713_02690, partial [Pirellulales bacterium]|nr:hypothetical protein [Pirellulales bacterium]
MKLYSRLWFLVMAVAPLLPLGVDASARADDAPPATIDIHLLRRKQQAQQRARDLARDLVSRMLDVQLQQLEENGLDDLPLYRDVRQMRTHIDGLVEAEMNDVVTMLVLAQDEPPGERETTFVAARQKIRDVVVRLTAERQNLHRRLKTAELAAQVKRLIEMETISLGAVRAAQSTADERGRAALAVSTAQDQRDLQSLFERFVESLHEVRAWGGEVGRGAAETLVLVRASQIHGTIDQAIEQLDAADLSGAVQSQSTIIEHLTLLLQRIESTQGL